MSQNLGHRRLTVTHLPREAIEGVRRPLQHDEFHETAPDESEDGEASPTYSGWSWWRRQQWTPGEWLRDSSRYGSESWPQAGDEESEEDQDEDVPWDELEVEEREILPDEVLGWILLRRAGLTTQNRLAVQASVGNSLRYDAIERALRDQEEELLAAERRPPGKGHGYKGGAPKRTSSNGDCWTLNLTKMKYPFTGRVHDFLLTYINHLLYLTPLMKMTTTGGRMCLGRNLPGTGQMPLGGQRLNLTWSSPRMNKSS